MVSVGDSLAPRDGYDLHLAPAGIRPGDIQIAGIDGIRNQHPAAARGVAGQRAGLCQGAAPVVHGGVGDIHRRQVANHGLVFKDRLQDALAQFRLIRGIGGVEFRTQQQLFHHGGNVMIVGAGAQKAWPVVHGGVPCGELSNVLAQLLFGAGRLQVQVPDQPQSGGDIGEEVVPAMQSHELQHLPDDPGRIGHVSHGCFLPPDYSASPAQKAA